MPITDEEKKQYSEFLTEIVKEAGGRALAFCSAGNSGTVEEHLR
jgi:hypothetical protein